MNKKVILSLCAALAVWTATAQTEQNKEEYWHGKVRELRYSPEGEEFVIINGNRKFTRALYGTNTAFRVETSDVPEFALFMPRMGGNLQFRLYSPRTKREVALNEAKEIEARYRPGSRIYTIHDPILGNGEIVMTALAMGDADGFLLKTEFINVPPGVTLRWAFGGASDNRLDRNGDMNADPENVFYLLPEYCVGNRYTLDKNVFRLEYGDHKQIRGIFPATVSLSDARRINRVETFEGEKDAIEYPMTVGTIEGNGTHYIALYNPNTLKEEITYTDLPTAFAAAEEFRQSVANRIKIDTPDPFLNTVGGAISMAGDAIWEYPVYHHGAIGWRTRLPGWRGAYTGDFQGWHDRARTHFDAYGAVQFTNPVDKPVIMDTTLNLARSAKVLGTPMYSSGYIAPTPVDPATVDEDYGVVSDKMSHYDMNLVYIDALLWHLNWTGDVEYARKMWPVLQRHLAWEKRNFDPEDDGLYDAYACIWASDALQYNSGAVTHSSAYNYRANKMAAEIAEKIGENPAPYRKEAEKIFKAVEETLWLPDRGWWAEFKEWGGHERLHPNAAVWTFYHAVDSELSPEGFKAYQAGRYINTEIPHIPVRARNYNDGTSYVVSTTNWMPYHWSINNVAIAESGHTALALWQAGHTEEAFHLFKGLILDVMYMGGSPGNTGQVSFYDSARGETYRDFADPTGVLSRAVVQGLLGLYPDLMNGRIELRPGLPAEWEHASIATPDLSFDFRRQRMTDSYRIVQNLPKQGRLTLTLPAPYDAVKAVTVNGKTVGGSYRKSVGKPTFTVVCGDAKELNVTIEWAGNKIVRSAEFPAVIANGNRMEVKLARGQQLLDLYDPQGATRESEATDNGFEATVEATLGHRTLFAQVQQGEAVWFMPVEFEVIEPIEIKHNLQQGRIVYQVVNNSDKRFTGKLRFNYQPVLDLDLTPGGRRSRISPAPEVVKMGSNRVEVLDENGKIVAQKNLMNWEIHNPENTKYEPVEMSDRWNDRVVQIFRNKYLSPRSPQTTLQIPVQGIGEWCVPMMTADINDAGIREQTRNGLFQTPLGVMFTSEADSTKNNIAYTSLWDNYPEQIEVPLEGKASHAYLLMAGSTNHIQCHMVNGTVTVVYQDGTQEQLELINPETWAPIEQDFFIDGEAFRLKAPRPYRVQLSTGLVTRDMEGALGLRGAYEGRRIPGGAATILDLPLDPAKTLKKLVLKTESLEVVIGLMGVTLVRE